MITKEDLEAGAKEIQQAIEQTVANYNALQGKLSVVNTLLEKFAPGVTQIEEGVGKVLDGASDIAEGVVSVASELS